MEDGALLAIVTFCTRRAGTRSLAHGAWCRCHLRWAHPRIRHTIFTAAPTTAFSRWRLCFIHHTIRSLGELSAFAPLAFFPGGFQTTFLSSIATLLQFTRTKATGVRIMSLFGLINRGLGSIGSFPFGLVANRDRRSMNSGKLWISDY